MALIDQVKAVCDRLGAGGFRELLLEVTNKQLDISQPTTAALRTELSKKLASIDRTFPGFEDFDPAGDHAITAGDPGASLLYHALASPLVVRGATGQLLAALPTMPELEVVENYVFGVKPPTLAELHARHGTDFEIVTFALEYRPGSETASGQCANLTFSRTGIARVGTSRPLYDPATRGYWPEDADNPSKFRVVPARFDCFLAKRVTAANARVMRVGSTQQDGNHYWIPVHKLFQGDECIAGLTLTQLASSAFFNMKLQRVLTSLGHAPRVDFPYVIDRGLATVENGAFGRFAVVPEVRDTLVEPAFIGGVPQSYRVPPSNGAFATYETPTPGQVGGREVHPFPAYVHARTEVKGGELIDLNEEADGVAVGDRIATGGYDALLYIDFTGEGWIDIAIPELAGRPHVLGSRPAYVLLSAPDFFPSAGQRELSQWSSSKQVPGSFRGGQLWGVAPEPLSEERLPANLQLPRSPFDATETTMTAVVEMGEPIVRPPARRLGDPVRASTLPDDAAGVFAPGWDASVDVDPATNMVHLTGYGLGSPFPEDAKLCAALSTFWPSVAPDVYRSMSQHSGNSGLRGTVAPLTDEEIGMRGSPSWDGVRPPRVVVVNGARFFEMATFRNVDYVRHAVENRFSTRLSHITTEEYQDRIVSAARVHWVLSGGVDVAKTRAKWLFTSFAVISSGDADVVKAQSESGFTLDGTIYRVEASFVGGSVVTQPSPEGPRFRLLRLNRETTFLVSASSTKLLRKRTTDAKWSVVTAE